MPDAPADPAAWGSCRFCGVAVPPGAAHCEICGADGPLPAGTLTAAPKAVRRRVQWAAGLRSLIVAGVVIGLAVTLVQAVIAGPPNVPDPLTTAGVHEIPAGGTWVLSGNVTGGDYVTGNFTTIDPAGLSLGLDVYNSSQYFSLGSSKPTTPLFSISPAPTGRIVFTADYTDRFYFVFWNPYAPSSGLNVTAYITTEYESNVGDEGFG